MAAMRESVLLSGIVLLLASPAAADETLVVGVTTRAYSSWVANVAEGTPVEVVPVIPADRDPHGFQARPEDLARLGELDVLVANGLGHDAFVDEMLRAAGRDDLPRIDLHQGVPLVPYHPGTSHRHAGDPEPQGEQAFNPHTFLSLSTAIQQVYNLERGLARLRPGHAETFRMNARAYASRLRKMKAWAAEKLTGARVTKVATVHDGYVYLLQEFGIDVAAVVQPRHGIEPSAGELAGTIEAIRAAKVEVVFSELDFPREYVDLIRRESGVRLYHLSHLSRGEYTARAFEDEMRANLETLIRALVEDGG